MFYNLLRSESKLIFLHISPSSLRTKIFPSLLQIYVYPLLLATSLVFFSNILFSGDKCSLIKTLDETLKLEFTLLAVSGRTCLNPEIQMSLSSYVENLAMMGDTLFLLKEGTRWAATIVSGFISTPMALATLARTSLMSSFWVSGRPSISMFCFLECCSILRTRTSRWLTVPSAHRSPFSVEDFLLGSFSTPS